MGLAAWLLVVLLGGLWLDVVESAAPDTYAKVMSFNLRTSLARDPCPAGCWHHRQWRAKALVAKYQPDFWGTQEGAPDQIAFLLHETGYAGIGECAGPCATNEHDMLFFNNTRWRVLEQGTFALSDTPDVLPSNTWDLEYLRSAVWGRFLDRVTGQAVCIMNTHFDITRGQNRSAVLIAKRLQRVCQPLDLVVFLGDLNAEPTSAPVKFLLNQAPINGTLSTCFPMIETLSVAGAGGGTWIGSSFGNALTGGKIDYIMARDDLWTCVVGGKVILDTFDGYGVSDHATVLSEFCLGVECTGCLNGPFRRAFFNEIGS